MSFGHLIRCSLLRGTRWTPMMSRNCLASNQSSKSATDPRITITDDGQTIVCWHCEPTFPYEHTKPLPNQSVDENQSVFKHQYLVEGQNLHSQNPNVEELQMMTFTPQIVWREHKSKRLFENRLKPIHYRPGHHV